MSPKTKIQLENISEKSREKIMQTALELFAKRGFHATSIRMIAKEAGISLGLMYNYFKSKEELLQEIIVQGLSKIQLGMIEEYDQTENAGLDWLLENIFHSIKEHAKFWKLYIIVLMQPESMASAKKVVEPFFDHFYQAFEEFYKKKGVENPEMESQMLGIIIHGVLLRCVMDEDLSFVDSIKKELIRKYQ